VRTTDSRREEDSRVSASVFADYVAYNGEAGWAHGHARSIPVVDELEIIAPEDLAPAP